MCSQRRGIFRLCATPTGTQVVENQRSVVTGQLRPKVAQVLGIQTSLRGNGFDRFVTRRERIEFGERRRCGLFRRSMPSGCGSSGAATAGTSATCRTRPTGRPGRSSWPSPSSRNAMNHLLRLQRELVGRGRQPLAPGQRRLAADATGRWAIVGRARRQDAVDAKLPAAARRNKLYLMRHFALSSRVVCWSNDLFTKILADTMFDASSKKAVLAARERCAGSIFGNLRWMNECMTQWARRVIAMQIGFPTYAARLRLTIGRCRRPAWNSTHTLKRSPGCPATSVRGLAHGDPRGQRFRGSTRGHRLAGRNTR